jgi:peptidoglycan/LPS O-acetylase OafA/YrhL
VALLVSYAAYLSASFSPDFFPARFTTFITLYIYFAAGAALFIFRDRVPFSGSLALSALLVLLIALPAGWGPVFLPLALPYITTFCGLSIVPGHALIKRDLSYGVYLIHAPMVVAFGILFPNISNWVLLAVIVSIVTGLLSYLCRRLVEEPALRKKKALSKWIGCQIAVIRG